MPEEGTVPDLGERSPLSRSTCGAWEANPKPPGTQVSTSEVRNRGGPDRSWEKKPRNTSKEAHKRKVDLWEP